MDYQICDNCGKNKELSYFRRSRRSFKKDPSKEWYYFPTCKACSKDKKSIQAKKYNDTHKEEKAKTSKEYRNKNKEELSQKKKDYYIANKDYIDNKSNTYYKEKMNDPVFVEKEKKRNKVRAIKNRPVRNAWRREQRKINPVYKLRSILSKSIWQALKNNGGSKAGISFEKRFSYSIDVLKKHLEDQFSLPENLDPEGNVWMTWENQGHYSVKDWNDNDPTTWKWQIDHIMPQSKFVYTSMDDQAFKDCWALSNLRPYSAKQNVLDGVNRVRH